MILRYLYLSRLWLLKRLRRRFDSLQVQDNGWKVSVKLSSYECHGDVATSQKSAVDLSNSIIMLDMTVSVAVKYLLISKISVLPTWSERWSK